MPNSAKNPPEYKYGGDIVPALGWTRALRPAQRLYPNRQAPVLQRRFQERFGTAPAGAHWVHADIETCMKVAKTARLAWRGLPYLPALSHTLPCGDAAVTSEVASSSLVHPTIENPGQLTKWAGLFVSPRPEIVAVHFHERRRRKRWRFANRYTKVPTCFGGVSRCRRTCCRGQPPFDSPILK